MTANKIGFVSPARQYEGPTVERQPQCNQNIMGKDVEGSERVRGTQQKLHLFVVHEEGIGPRTLSRLTGVPYSIVQRATSDTVRYGSMVCESLPGDEEYETYIDDTEYEKYPDY